MWADIIEIRNFYNSTLGLITQRLINRRIRNLWPDVTGLELLGIGYTTPYLDSFRHEAKHNISAMPAAQGVLHWPAKGENLTSLVNETELPIADVSIDRVLLVHALENSENIRPMMREVWRILESGGRLIVVAPNRRGLWASFDSTPFGRGSPYSMNQLSVVLEENMFIPHQKERALFIPPTNSKMALSFSAPVEEIGHYWFPAFAGVNIIESTKQIYARHTEKQLKHTLIRVPQRNTTTSTQES